MKSHTIASLVVSGMCLASAGTMRADNVSISTPDPSKHHHYDNPAGPEAVYGAEDFEETSATGATGSSSTTSTGQEIIKAKSLLGMDVKNMQDQKLGHVRDVVVDKDSGRVNFAIMEKADRAKGTPENVAVHVEELKASSDMKSLLLDIDKERVAQAK